MGVITPILDTLLHEVLGKRANFPLQRELNPPVKPMDPTGNALSVRSDSRLDQRPLLPQAVTAGTREAGNAPPRAGHGTPPLEAAATSSHTSLSPSARVIAVLLAKFPAPPSVLRAQVPLVSELSAPISPSQLASRLHGSVSESGLFYESHLARWYRGEVTLTQLARQPQMWLTRDATPLSAASLSGSPSAAAAGQQPLPLALRASASVQRTAVGDTQPTIPTAGSASAQLSLASMPASVFRLPAGLVQVPVIVLPPGAPLTTQAGSAVRDSPTAARAVPGQLPNAPGQAYSSTPPSPADSVPGTSVTAGDRAAGQAQEQILRSAQTQSLDSSETLQGLVRHQLELLATPVLRWEGDVWSGVFMALMVQVPAVTRENRDAREEGDQGKEEQEQDGWYSEMTLEVRGLGQLKVSLRLQAQEQLDLTLQAASADVLQQLQAGRDALLTRLHNCGFSSPVLTMSLWQQGEAHEPGA